MKHYKRALLLCMTMLSFHPASAYAAQLNSQTEPENVAETNEITADEEIIEADVNENAQFNGRTFDASANEVVRFEVIYDRTFPDMYITYDKISHRIENTSADSGAEIIVREVEKISGQNLAVVYFIPSEGGTFGLSFKESTNSTIVIAKTVYRDDFRTNALEKRLEVTDLLYDIVGPSTLTDIDTLLSTEYDPYLDEASNAIKDAPAKSAVFIPLWLVIVFSAIIVILPLYLILKKREKKKMALIEEERHNELLDEIKSSEYSNEEENTQLMEYWEMIKNEYEAEPSNEFWSTEPTIIQTSLDDIYHRKIVKSE